MLLILQRTDRRQLLGHLGQPFLAQSPLHSFRDLLFPVIVHLFKCLIFSWISFGYPFGYPVAELLSIHLDSLCSQTYSLIQYLCPQPFNHPFFPPSPIHSCPLHTSINLLTHPSSIVSFGQPIMNSSRQPTDAYKLQSPKLF